MSLSFWLLLSPASYLNESLMSYQEMPRSSVNICL